MWLSELQIFRDNLESSLSNVLSLIFISNYDLENNQNDKNTIKTKNTSCFDEKNTVVESRIGWRLVVCCLKGIIK